MAERTFTFEQACALMSEVRQKTRAAVDEVEGLEVPFDDADDPDEAKDKLREAAGKVLARWAGEMNAMGIEVKGPWLIDFDSGAGYYCWRWPEESLQFFHGYEEGFAGRVRIQ